MHTETFSYLPQMSKEQVKGQIEYILKNGWIPGVEFTGDPGPGNSYWHFWKLPLFNAKTASEVLAEIDQCREANPGCYIKITGYDNRRQGQVLSFVVHRPQ
jgi:ribulose-bisphosphate carboxylase small chain